MNRLIFPCLLILAIANITCNAEDTRPQLQNIHNSEVTVISKLAPKEKILIYNIGIKDKEALPDVLKSNAIDSFKYHIETPTFLYVGLAGNMPLYVKPGDRIIAKNDTLGNLYFTNIEYPERSAELNFFFELQHYLETVGKKKASETKTEDHFLDSLINVQHLSADFVQKAKQYILYNNLKFSYIASLRNNDSGANLKPFPQNDSCIYVFPYRGALYNYIMLLSNKKNSKEFNFNRLNEIVKNNFTGDTKEYALFMFLNFKMNTQLNEPDFIVAYRQFLDLYPNDSLTNYLKTSYNKKIEINNSFKKDIYKELLVNKANKLIPFSDILQKNKGKIIVLDFWARYCGPCLAEIPYGKKLENEFSNKGVIFIYLSTDHEYDKWVDKIKELGIGDSKKSYLLYLPEKSGILKYFKIQTIPRYVVIGKSGKIISRDAPNPSDPAFREMLIQNL